MSKQFDHIDQQLRTFYAGQSLDADELRELKQQLSTPRPASPEADRRARTGHVRRYVTAGVALALFAVLVTSVVLWYANQSTANQELYRIASEIVLNHEKQLSPDIYPEAFAGIAAEMDKLDFDPVEPERVREGPFQLVGARYCSIGASIAAQVHLDGPTGERCTMYQFRPDDPGVVRSSAEVMVNGYRVQLWREDDLLTGLVCTEV